MKKLQIQAFFDNTKGHEKQTQAILDSLDSLTPVNICRSHVGPRSLVNSFRFFFDKLRYKFKADLPESNGPDLIIGTGSNCHLPMLIAGQHAPGARVVTCMTPEKFLIDHFDLCLVPTHDRVKDRDRIFRTVGPPCPIRERHEHNTDKGLILVGGIDPKSHYWDTTRVVDQVREIIGHHKIHWTISSSPRTPEETSQALEKLCDNNKNSAFFRAENTPTGWIEERYHEAFLSWVTGDSVSMVYEALSAGCKVGILPVKWKSKDNKFQRGINSLDEKMLLVSYDQWLADEPLSDLRTTFDEAGRCAKEILRRWWPDRLEKMKV